MLFAVACSSPTHDAASASDLSVEEPTPSGLGGPIPHETSEHRPLEALSTLDPATTCGRAQACCRAFAAATPNVVSASACAETVEAAEREDADARCERMIVGWRIALDRNADVEPPPTCAAPR